MSIMAEHFGTQMPEISQSEGKG